MLASTRTLKELGWRSGSQFGSHRDGQALNLLNRAASPAPRPQDFGGFRIVVVLPRYVSHWPYPGSTGNREGKKTHPEMGAPLPPYPLLQTHGRPVSAATIRSGPGYLEIPFVATHEGKRGRGYCRYASTQGQCAAHSAAQAAQRQRCAWDAQQSNAAQSNQRNCIAAYDPPARRCLIEAVEDIARALQVPKLMLCSTNDPIVKSTWHHLGFDFTSEEEMEHWDIPHSDLVYLQNTTQVCGGVSQVKAG
jgi:hypothetical protein